MAFGFSITENLGEHLADGLFLEAFHAWSSWVKEDRCLPEIGGPELEAIQHSRNQQARFSKDDRGEWFCSDFAPGLVDFTGFSLAGQTLESGGKEFAKIHIDNCELSFKKTQPVFCRFRAVKATNVSLWEALYLPVHSTDIDKDEIIVIFQPTIYRQDYLEGLLNALPHGLMTVLRHPVDGQKDQTFQVIECNRPMSNMMNKRMRDIAGIDLPSLWPEADQEALEKVLLSVLDDGMARNFNSHYTQEGDLRSCIARISRTDYGLIIYIWDVGPA